MDDTLDPIWKALSDPTRRAILDLLRDEPRSTGEIAAAFPEVTRFAVMKHLRALEAARLVLTRKEGRRRLHYLNAARLREVYDRWVGRWGDAWASGLSRLAQRAEAQGGEVVRVRARVGVGVEATLEAVTSMARAIEGARVEVNREVVCRFEAGAWEGTEARLRVLDGDGASVVEVAHGGWADGVREAPDAAFFWSERLMALREGLERAS